MRYYVNFDHRLLKAERPLSPFQRTGMLILSAFFLGAAAMILFPPTLDIGPLMFGLGALAFGSLTAWNALTSPSVENSHPKSHHHKNRKT